MSTYSDLADSGAAGNAGGGVQFRPAVSDVFGHFGGGVVLATNFVLVVQDELGNPVDAGLAYTLSYYDPATGQNITLSLFHNPAFNYQRTVPGNQVITFALDSVNPGRYAAGQSASTTVANNGYGVLLVKLSYPPGTLYAHLIRKHLSA